MAEYGAHITLTSNIKPSIFDVVAQEHLMGSLQPAFKHILRIISENNPERYSWCFNYNEEIFCLFHALVQHHYLSHYGASFAENFYDLKRIPLKGDANPLTLKKMAHKKSMITLVIYYYVYNKLENLFIKIREDDPSEDTWKVKFQLAFLKVWPYFHMSVEFIKLVFYIRYMIGKSSVHSPFLFLCGLSLAHLTEDDYDIIEERSKSLPKLNEIRNLQNFSKWFGEKFGNLLMTSFEISAFFLQFLDWFYSSGQTSSTLSSSMPIPPAPQEKITDISNVPNTHCPLCLKERQGDTVCSVSGYVFCYACILLFVRREGRCPLTGYPTSTNHLIRIYKQE